MTEWQSRKDMIHTVGELAKAWLAKGLQGAHAAAAVAARGTRPAAHVGAARTA